MTGRASIDLRDRTKRYASEIVRLFTDLPRSHVAARTLGKQLLRSGTSVAANFREAARARTSAEFVSKLEICVQEADESDLWLELLRDDCGITNVRLQNLLAETNELIAIFVTMCKRTKSKL
jgi:four helix bundle protein